MCQNDVLCCSAGSDAVGRFAKTWRVNAKTPSASTGYQIAEEKKPKVPDAKIFFFSFAQPTEYNILSHAIFLHLVQFPSFSLTRRGRFETLATPLPIKQPRAPWSTRVAGNKWWRRHQHGTKTKHGKTGTTSGKGVDQSPPRKSIDNDNEHIHANHVCHDNEKWNPIAHRQPPNTSIRSITTGVSRTQTTNWAPTIQHIKSKQPNQAMIKVQRSHKRRYPICHPYPDYDPKTPIYAPYIQPTPHYFIQGSTWRPERRPLAVTTSSHSFFSTPIIPNSYPWPRPFSNSAWISSHYHPDLNRAIAQPLSDLTRTSSFRNDFGFDSFSVSSTNRIAPWRFDENMFLTLSYRKVSRGKLTTVQWHGKRESTKRVGDVVNH